MSSKNLKRPVDSSRINVEEPSELQYWSKTLRVSKPELKAAVRNVGTGVEKVKEFLGVR